MRNAGKEATFSFVDDPTARVKTASAQEKTMTLYQFFLILRARRNIILATMLLTVIAVMVVSLVMPKAYKSTATVVLNPGVDPVTGNAMPGQLMPSYLATQVGVIGSKNVALKVVRDAKLEQVPEYREKFEDATNGRGNLADWLAERLLKKLDVTSTRESNVIDVAYTDSDPQQAAAIANTFATAYQQTNMELRLEPIKRASAYFNGQIKVHREQLEAARNRLSKYQQEKGIANLDNSLDVETIRLNELTTQLVTVQNQLMEANSRQGQANGKSAADSPDVLANPMIQNLRLSLAEAEAKLSQVGERYTTNHPRYEEASAEVNKLRAELRRSTQSASSGLAKSAIIAQQRESKLKAALAAQKMKVLELNRARDELNLLANEVESSQKAYDNILQRLSLSTLEGQSSQSEVTILSAAVAPFNAARPKPLLYLALAILGGALLGVGLGMLAEIYDRRVRTVGDLADVLQAPVLGSIEWGAPRQAPLALPGWNPSRPILPN
jgi:succinoglycan biosynthesis transport protein ExoP